MRLADYPQGVYTIDPDLRIRSVSLAVSDLARSVDFYQRVLGLPLITREGSGASLGLDVARPTLALSEIEHPTRLRPDATGLFHVAWLHPSRAELAASVQRIADARWPIGGASDHGVSEALYLSDPDGLGIEIYADRPRSQWERPADGRGVRMVTLALDLDDLLAQAPAAPVGEVASTLRVGHVHVTVSDVARAVEFYGGTLGFEEQARMPSAAFLSAGGYHHHIGLNSWQSAGAPAPADSAPGLRDVRFELGGQHALAELERALGTQAAPAGAGGVSVRDPDGQLLTFVAAPNGERA
jgi:catechol 2,3-dioxygenase